MNRSLTAALAAIVVASRAPAFLPGLPDTVVPRDWVVCGPFPAAPREGIIGAIDDVTTFRPQPGDSFRSALVQGGLAIARLVRTDSTGWLETGYENVRWDTIQDFYGVAGLVCAGYAYAEVECPYACRALAVATKLGGFVLNGNSFLGDVYGNGWFKTPVRLDSGVNRVLLRISGYGDERVRFLLIPPLAPISIVTEDITAPDMVPDSGFAAWFGIPLLNNTADRINKVELKIRFASDSAVAETVVRNLPALGVKKAPLRVRLPKAAYDSSGLRVIISAQSTDATSALGVPEHEAVTETLRLPFRRPDQPRRETFLSAIDNSCQYYAVLYPKDYDPSRRYPVIFTLHGAGVEAWGQANAYKQKDWAFVVAPTNRRPYGFDWQDWGRLDAIEVLDTILKRMPIDPDRVLLAGGSMGGHGDWHVGLNHPDRFAVVAPQASWPTHQLYVPWFLQRTEIFAQPGQRAVRDMALRSDNVPALLGNALNLPFFVLHGGDDDNVPTWHGRSFAAWLEELGQDFVYRELPGRRHWWTDTILGITVADDTGLMNCIKDKRRVTGPRHVRFRTGDLGTSHRAYWVDIERVRVIGRDAAIEAWALDSLVRVQTENTARFRLDLDGEPFFSGAVVVEVDGRPIGRRHSLPAHLTFERGSRSWKLVGPATPALRKTAALYGPAKQAMMSPFIIAYGTRDSTVVEFLRHAATQEALRWWLIGNGTTEVLPDSEVSDSMVRTRNLVLYGGADENAISRRLAGSLPIQIRNHSLYLGSTELGDSLAAMLVYPNPLGRDHLVLVRLGTDAEYTRLSTFWGLLSSGSGIPDFVIFGKRVRRYGWAGVRAAGFFGPDWNLDPASTYLQD